MAHPYDARDDRDLAHSLMAVLRHRYEMASHRRVFRGESPQRIGRTGAAPVASGALLDARTGRIAVVAEAIDAHATSASVAGALDRVGPLLGWVGERDGGEEVSEPPEVWMCAPAPARDALEAAFAMPRLRWVPYDVTGIVLEPLGGPPALHEPDLASLIAKRDAIVKLAEQACAERLELLRESARAHAHLAVAQSVADADERRRQRGVDRPRRR